VVFDEREKREVFLLGEVIMFERLTKHNVILVSGPQRSGTTIAAKMIAADTGYGNIDETGYGVYSRKRFTAIICQDRIVVQCPTMSHVLHKVATDETLVVFMVRDLEDIVASERRINWTIGPYKELANYGLSRKAARRYRHHGGQVAPLKYAFWWGTQRELVPHYLELDYESLSAHPLWVSREQRAQFNAKQTVT